MLSRCVGSLKYLSTVIRTRNSQEKKARNVPCLHPRRLQVPLFGPWAIEVDVLVYQADKVFLGRGWFNNLFLFWKRVFKFNNLKESLCNMRSVTTFGAQKYYKNHHCITNCYAFILLFFQLYIINSWFWEGFNNLKFYIVLCVFNSSILPYQLDPRFE